MANQIIASGKVIQWVGNLYVEQMIDADHHWFELGIWAHPYIGKTITISLEVKEEGKEGLDAR